MVWLAAALLSLERVTYVLVSHFPDHFRRWTAHPAIASLGRPVEVLALMFVAFKALQVGVFVCWCLVQSDGNLRPYSQETTVLGVGLLLVACGQTLNLSVFRVLGKTGVFYGNKLGHTVNWRHTFPFTWLEHPQYVGSVLSIWGFFVAMRFPAGDWAVIPVLETVYYAIGARLERDADHHRRLDRDVLGV